MRLRYKLEGYASAWNVGGGFMYLEIRFVDDAGDQVDFKSFRVQGDSKGWNGTPEDSTLTHRSETVVVPPRATQVQIIISSAGPPSTVGIYVVDDLVVSKSAGTDRPAEVLLRAPLSGSSENSREPPGWIRDGIHPQMAKIIELGGEPKIKAFAIFDDYAFGHAEWCNNKAALPRVTPGDTVVLNWNELFSMGVGDLANAAYPNLPPGKYQFRVEETDAYGGPVKAQVSLAVLVPLPFWEMPWFLAMLTVAVLATSTASVRYLLRRKMQRAMYRLQQQNVLEQERLRIARDIHDDIGARVTQISLVSALALADVADPEKTRAELESISRMSRDLVSALYETVWAVNPENDNLHALGTYLCQKINELCTHAQLRCRLHVAMLPWSIQISSQTRHNISMAVKEAVHNVIKHARASQLTVDVTFSEMLLTVCVQDDGCGFDVVGSTSGNGLVNMKRRLEDMDGSFLIESQPGQGTTVQLRMVLRSLDKDHREKRAPRTPVVPSESRAEGSTVNL